MSKIESDKLFVKDVFDKWYRIPEYQRPYVWGSDQVIELLDDIHKACKSNPDSEYFLGSMVLLKKKESTYEEYDLLDGQQRLTTLFIISAVVRDLAKTLTMNDDEKKVLAETAEQCIYQKKNLFKNIPERIRIIFDIRDKVRDYVAQYIMNNDGTIKFDELKQLVDKKGEDISIRNMSNAILITHDYFNNNPIISEFYQYLLTKVLMIYVAAEELQDAFHLFTVMNNRGIKLRNSDILKAENLKFVDETARLKYAKKWESTEEYFSEDFDNFLSHLRTILVKQKAGYNLLKEYEENIYAPKEFDRNTKKYIPKPALLTKGQSTFDFIDTYYKHYVELFEESHAIHGNYNLSNMITLMRTGFEADFWIAPLLKYYDKYKNNQLISFLKLLDKKFSSDWIIGLSPTDRIENINLVLKEIEISKDVNDLFSSSVFNINNDDLVRILTGNIYGRRYARYIMLKIDLLYHGDTTIFTPPATISIEHILPQTPDLSSQWIVDFDEESRAKWTNRLGNLILLSRRKNSSQGNLDYSVKKSKYFNKNVELFSNSVRIFKSYDSWTPNDLIQNHQDVLAKLFNSYEINLSKDDFMNLKN